MIYLFLSVCMVSVTGFCAFAMYLKAKPPRDQEIDNLKRQCAELTRAVLSVGAKVGLTVKVSPQA